MGFIEVVLTVIAVVVLGAIVLGVVGGLLMLIASGWNH